MTRPIYGPHMTPYGVRLTVEYSRPRWWPTWDFFEGLVGWLVIAILVLAILVVAR